MELARWLECDPRYIQKLIKAGVLPAGHLGTDANCRRRYRIPPSAAEELLRAAKLIE